jgi:hypothetical protein
VLASQPRVNIAPASGDVLAHGRVHILPPRFEYCAVEVFRTRHWRRSRYQLFQLCAWNGKHDSGPVDRQGGHTSEPCHEQMGELAAESQRGGQGAAQFHGA